MKLFSYTSRTSIPALCLALLTLFVWQQQSGRFNSTSTSSSASPSASPSAGGGTQRLASAEQVPDGLQPGDWNSIRSAYEKKRHAVVAVEGGQRAHNPGQQWRTRFDGRGFAVTPDQGDWTWGLELDSYGFAAAPRAVGGQARVTTEGERVAYQWDETLEEWYVNDRRGLEHGFTLKARPASADRAAAGPLELRLRVRGKLRAQVTADGQGVSFVQPSGGAVVNYSGLKVWDADGKAVAARFAPVDGDGDLLRLTVEESGARYPLTIDPIAQQAYLKASNTGASDRFGFSVAVSGDTVVVGAIFEGSSATGVNGDGTNNDASDSGAAYVFVRSGTLWSQQAYLKASNTGAGDYFGASVAVSGDTVVVGAYQEDSNATGVNGDGTNNLATDSGAAYVFVRSGTTWTQQAYLKASNTGAYDNFGRSVAVSGDTVVVGAYNESSNATGVNGNQENNSALSSGAAYVFVRGGTTWSQQAYLKAANTGAFDSFGYAVAVSGDTVVVGAIYESSNATGVNGDGTNNLANRSGAAYVFVRSGTAWTQQAYLKASNTGVADLFGQSVAVSGETVVVGAYQEASNATGVNGDGTNNLATDSGAAYVFVRSGTTWSQQAYLKAADTAAQDFFGISVAISGDTVVVGAMFEDSNATGVNGAGANYLAGDSGAAYVFNGVGVTNSPPTISSNNVPVQAGSSTAGFTIATAADSDQAVNTLGITINGNPTTATSNGVTVSNVAMQANGSVTANISTTCAATTATFNLVVTDNRTATGNGTLTVTITPNTPPVLTYAPQTVTAGTTPVIAPATGPSDNGTFSIGSVAVSPNNGGLVVSLNQSSGTVSVVSALVIGTYTVTVPVTDNCGATTNAQLTINVFNGCPTITLNQTSLPSATTNTAYAQSLSASPAGGNYSFAVTSGLLPPGLTLNSNGSFSGAPTQSGTFNFRVTATGFGSCSGFQDYVMNVGCTPITVSPASLPGGSIGTAYNQNVSASPAGSYSYSITLGSLPSGLTLNTATGLISGTPIIVGNFTFTITALATGGCTASQSYALAVTCPTVTLAPNTLPDASTGATYNQTLSAAPVGGSYTYIVTTGSLPTGLNLNASTGVISGTPTVANSFTFRVTATGFGGCSGFRDYTIVIGGG
ncbi:MAG TPA: putative Ig domain-containing protein, partial [Blastocatellia bacterium]|nr:putative Ig domain-containing protein [Blastocatellia bacterium]